MVDPLLAISETTILIIDDSAVNLRLLTRILRQQGYSVYCATSGAMALVSVQTTLPDLILLDIRMPEMDGYEVCRILKADPKTCAVPIIFLSALDEAIDKVEAFAVGGVDYITKPFQVEEVLVRINHQLQLKQLQKQLVEKNEALSKSNQELEQFSYIVSHDLQQPLQSVSGFAQIILLKAQTVGLDEEIQQYLHSIVAASDRMQQLIQDLLIYAQVRQPDQNFTCVDCNLIVQEALSNLESALFGVDVAFSIEALPTVKGQATQLMQLWQNLLSNAIKFKRPDVQLEIQISAQPQEQEWLFQIYDNGIGIQANHLSCIFEVFQRLYSRQQYPGSGIGLATCRKIVENHGGRIWAESEFGAWTKFSFTLKR
jgi:two-component system, sensor histidine kinase and response regulator